MTTRDKSYTPNRATGHSDSNKSTLETLATLAGLVSSVLGLIGQLIGISTPDWYNNSVINFGLWKYCVLNDCSSFPDSVLSDALKASRAFSVLGLLPLALCCLCAVLMLFLKARVLPVVAAITGLVAALCIMIEFAVFAGERSGDSDHYDYSFFLTVAAFLFSLLAGLAFTFVLWRRTKTVKQRSARAPKTKARTSAQAKSRDDDGTTAMKSAK